MPPAKVSATSIDPATSNGTFVPPSAVSPPPPADSPPSVSGTRAQTARVSGGRPIPSEPSRPEDFALFRFYQSSKRGETTRRMNIFVEAGDEALRRGDPVTAAQNYRMALQVADHPMVRAKLAAIEQAAEEAQRRRAARASRTGDS